MRSVRCDEVVFAEMIGEGGLYDYELGECYIVAPGPSSDHGELQHLIHVALAEVFPRVSGPTNLGVLGRPGERWYVVPDAIVLPDGAPRGVDAQLRALVAVEVRSPSELIATKLAHYREVMARTGLVVGEVWYIGDGAVEVHPNASDDIGPTSYEQAFDAVANAVQAWRQGT